MSRSDFVGLERVVHLAAGGEAPMLRAGLDAIHRFVGDKGMGYVGGYSGRRHFYETYAAAKSALAQLVACQPADVALVGSASDGIGVVASGLRFSPGENIVTVAHEFPSVSAPWLRLRSQGLEVREVEPSAARPLADLIGEACDSRTRLIAVSHVSYLTGERVELSALQQIAAAHGALLLVDASHSLGVLPVDAGAADFLVSCAYKFLLATHGVGVLVWNRGKHRDWPPDRLGWHAVRGFPPEGETMDLKVDGGRFEPGNPSFISTYVLETSVSYLLRRPAVRLEEHVLGLGSQFLKGLEGLGLRSTTPAEPFRRGPNICLAHPDADGLTMRLRSEGIYVWGGHDRVRVSFHGFCDDQDVARLVGALKRLLGR